MGFPSYLEDIAEKLNAREALEELGPSQLESDIMLLLGQVPSSTLRHQIQSYVTALQYRYDCTGFLLEKYVEAHSRQENHIDELQGQLDRQQGVEAESVTLGESEDAPLGDQSGSVLITSKQGSARSDRKRRGKRGGKRIHHVWTRAPLETSKCLHELHASLLDLDVAEEACRRVDPIERDLRMILPPLERVVTESVREHALDPRWAEEVRKLYLVPRSSKQFRDRVIVVINQCRPLIRKRVREEEGGGNA